MRNALLFLVYYLVVTPIGFVTRFVGDPLARGWKRDADTYWIPSESRPRHVTR